MIEDAQAKGLGSEKVMWKGVEDIDEMLCVIKKEHPGKNISHRQLLIA